MAGLLLLASFPVAVFREPPRAVPPRPPSPLAPLRDWFRRPGVGAWLGLLASVKAGDALASAMVRPFMVDQGLGLADVGRIIGTAGSVAGLLGALAGGALAGRIGRRPALLVATVLQLTGVLGYVGVAWAPSVPAVWVASTLEHFVGGMATAALFTAMMDTCRPGHESSDYTVQASIVVLATGMAGSLSGYAAKALGYAGHFGLSAAVCAIGVAYVWAYRGGGDFALAAGPPPEGWVA
jgi:predicted MFS family arabinose efflux permease